MSNCKPRLTGIWPLCRNISMRSKQKPIGRPGVFVCPLSYWLYWIVFWPDFSMIDASCMHGRGTWISATWPTATSVVFPKWRSSCRDTSGTSILRISLLPCQTFCRWCRTREGASFLPYQIQTNAQKMTLSVWSLHSLSPFSARLGIIIVDATLWPQGPLTPTLILILMRPYMQFEIE